MAQSCYPAGGDGRADGEAVGCRKMAPHSETRPDLPSGPRVLRRLAPAVALTSAAPITPSHEYYCSNNGKRPRNLQKLENNGLFIVAYSNVIILYRGVQTP